MESPEIAQADRLYEGFPDFSTWGELSSEDVDLWSRFAASLGEKRRQASPESLKAAVEVAVRAAALDTGAIEGLYNVDRGFTMTVAVQGLAWQQMVEERGAGVRELFEAQLAAYELVLDAVTHKLPITEAWIRALHETLCGPQKMYRVLTDQGWQEQELPKGQYKTRPNHVRLTDSTVHAYSPVDRVPSEMHRLIEQIRTPEFEAAHPVPQASYCHYAFVSIHPFADGNGRVARALASTFLYRAESIPLVIFENQRPAYLDVLALADRSDHGPLISFFKDRGIDTMQLVAESLMMESLPKPEDLASRMNQTAKAWRNLSESDEKTLSARIRQEILQIFRTRFAALKLQNLLAYATNGYEAFSIAGYRRPRGKTALRMYSDIPHHANLIPAQTELNICIFYSSRPQPFAFRIQAREISDPLEARLEDITPELTPHFLLRLDQWVQRQLGFMLSDISKKTKT